MNSWNQQPGLLPSFPSFPFLHILRFPSFPSDLSQLLQDLYLTSIAKPKGIKKSCLAEQTCRYLTF